MNGFSNSPVSPGERTKFVFFTVWSVGAIIAGVFSIWIATDEMASAIRSRSWPSVELSAIGQKQANPSKPIQKEIGYEYFVDGEKYFSGKIRFGAEDPIGDSAEIEGIIAEYKGSAVFYNPGMPNQSVLVPGVSGASFQLLLMPLFFLILGLLIYRNRAELSKMRLKRF